MEKEKTGSFQLIWFFFKPYKRYFVSLLILSLLDGVLEAVNVAAVYPILSTAFESSLGGGNTILLIFKRLADLLPISDEFIAYCVLFVITAILAFVVKFISIKIRTEFSAILIADGQSLTFTKFVKADYQYFIDHKQGDLLYDVSTATQRLSSLAISVAELVSQVILAISMLFILFTISWSATIGVVALGLGYYCFSRYLGGKVSYYTGKGELEAIKESTVILNETISGIKQVKVFAKMEDWINRFNNALSKRWYHYIRRAIWQQVPTPVLILILYSSAGIIAIVIKITAPGSFLHLIPLFGTFVFAVFRLMPIIGTIGGLIMGIMSSLPDCEIVYAIANEELARIKDGEKELGSFESEIRFDNVSFTHKGRKKTLENVSFVCEKGKTIAVVGRSGSGKTTIINLLLRLFEPDEGEIRIDGVNLKEYKLSSWLEKIGFVSQDTFVFHDTIRNNITFQSDQYPDEEVVKVAQYAEAHDFIAEMPDGYNTIVGDRGVRLSGGQSQRIAVARAIIRQPEILIFDEATNALDSISEAAVQRAIDKMSENHTVIVIAHRLSTIVNADKIVVLGDGRVLEQGTHKELMEKKGAYWELYRSQPT